MDNKDIYEHLAKIYLDASSKKKKKAKKQPQLTKKLFLISIPFIFGIAVFSFASLNRSHLPNSETALIIQPDSVKINFNFDPAKKETYTIDFKGLNLTRFRALGFSVKKTDYLDNLKLRIEFTNKFKEKSAIYVKDIPHKWQNYRIAFYEFKDIGDWSEILNLSFIVEEWNVKQKHGLVYLDNIRLLR